MEKSSELLKEFAEKIKVSSAEIVVHGTREKPYYEIKYHDLPDGQIHIGYSSYNLDFVFGWLEECFEIVKEAADTIESLYAKPQAANMERSADCGGWIPCKERLPEEEGMYLITSKVLDKTEVQYVFFQKNMDLFICNGIPTAWKPLPEPYHEP